MSSDRHPIHLKLEPEPAIPCPQPHLAGIMFPPGSLFEDVKTHYSDICNFINPDRDYDTAKALSIFGGLLGLDHFYLRSPTTAFAKIIVNCLTLGLWWVWDANQFAFEKEKVLNYGLNNIFDMGKGIGRGTLTDEKPEFLPKKDFGTFMILAIFFGFLGLDRMYLGGQFAFQGWMKFLSCFLLIGFIWVIHDMYQVLFQPGNILDDGYGIPLPFTAMYEPWDLPSAKFVGDLFQVTLTKQEKQILAEQASGSGSSSSSSGSGSSSSGSSSSGGISGIASLAKSTALQGISKRLDPLGKLASAVVGRQMGGGIKSNDSSDSNLITKLLLGTVVLTSSVMGGFQLVKNLRTA